MWRANTGGTETANAIWLSSDYTFAKRFVDTCTQDHMADAYPLIIPGAKDAVNTWADEKTHGCIRDIIAEELSDDTKIILANALYYLGDWEIPFEANDTYEREFSAPSGRAQRYANHHGNEHCFEDGAIAFMGAVNDPMQG